MSKLDKLPVKNEVIHQLAIGETQTNIAKRVGVDRSNILPIVTKFIGNAAIEKMKQAVNGEDDGENSDIEK